MDVRFIQSVLDQSFCRELIELFEQSRDTLPSINYSGSKDSDARRGSVVVLHAETYGTTILKKIIDVAKEQLDVFCTIHPGLFTLASSGYEFTAPRIEKIVPGEEFSWHMDSLQDEGDGRFLRFLFYLNEEFADGETEFYYPEIFIKPQSGSLLMFPPYWTHIHRGKSPSGGIKYTLGLFAAKRKK